MGKISLGLPKLPWPKEGDEPFLPAKDPRHEARLDMVHHTLSLYALAYKEAADRLVSCALRRRVVYPDWAVLPVIFLYRHYLELMLKEIICSGRRCSLKEAGISKEHDLSKLWNGARTVLEELWPEQGRRELRVVENCVRKFHQHDKTSQESRYPVDRDGRATLRSLTRVDIHNLKKVMAGVASFLDGCADGIDYLNSNRP